MKKYISIFIVSIILILFTDCGSKKYLIKNELKTNINDKIAIIKTRDSKFIIAKISKRTYDIIPTNKDLNIFSNYELDNVQKLENIVIIELFVREAGINSSIGFLFSNDYGHKYRYIDIGDIEGNAESIEKIEITSEFTRVYLYSLRPKRYFVSYDFCNTWQPF